MRLFLILIALASSTTQIFAMEGNQSQTFDYRPLSIDGQYNERPKAESDKMKLIREELEKKNEMLIRKKIENFRLHKEMMLEQKIMKLFEDQYSSSN